jgi:hypothetical protein
MATTKKHKLRTRRGAGKLQFLTQEELKRLFAVIKDQRDKTLFLLAYRHACAPRRSACSSAPTWT